MGIPLRDFFWEKIHISDASATLRWAISLFAVIALYPTFGSYIDLIIIGMVLFSLNYWIFAHVRSNRTEKLISIIVLIYVGISIFFPLLHNSPLDGVLFGLSNVGLLALVFLMPVFRQYSIGRHRNFLVLAFPTAGILMLLGVMTEAIYLDNLARAELLAGNALILAFLAGMTLIGCVVYGFHARKRRLAYFLAGFVSALIVLVLTGSRAPIVFAAFLALSYVLYAALKYRKIKVVYFFAFLAVGAGVAGFMGKDLPAAQYLQERTGQFLESLDSLDPSAVTDQSLKMRLAYYQTGWELVKERPLLGHGRNNVMDLAREKAPPEISSWFGKTHLHSGFLTELAGNGVFGLLSLIAVVFIPVIISYRLHGQEMSFAFLFFCYFNLYSATNIAFYHDLTALPFVAYTLLIYTLGTAHNPETV